MYERKAKPAKGNGPRERKTMHRKECKFCAEKVTVINYKDERARHLALLPFVSEYR
jgi:ribosomal protein S18